jgi:hypothetical protein
MKETIRQKESRFFQGYKAAVEKSRLILKSCLG